MVRTGVTPRSVIAALVALLAASSLSACRTDGEPVPLLTGSFACYAGGANPSEGGFLVPDEKFGIKVEGRGPMVWPEGYSAKRLASGQVVVLNPSGAVVAVTGRQYRWTPVPGAEGPDQPKGTDPIRICDSYAWDFEEAPTAGPG
jgi:hypothetical protein